MKKALVLALSFALTILALGQNIGEAYTIIYDTNGTASTTNYVGLARTTENTSGTISANDAKWKIVRTVLDASGNEVTVQNAYGSGVGDNALWTTAWTNRVNATYK